ncbi:MULTISPECIES: DUF3603 family protein [Oceanobacillus]|uniref:UPF0736 protein YjbA n=1 Tax=Oceanobacillus indicireducens TaxID=1004261 RepID=A0A917XYW5_9BACI|nr:MULTISPECIES: DUF3603 family protein [Oceanobacillus]GGN60326.1 UPF0736 protein YjbA [Oceanobacillus indicireducens]
MLYLHDVWVNWFESEENGYQVARYHEWRKEDKIELLDQTPLLYIKNDLFEYIENDLQEIPESLLDTIYKRSYNRKGQNRKAIEYACVITNGVETLAFDTIGYTIPVRKSRLIPRQEQLVYDMIKSAKAQNYGFKKRNYKKEYHILSMSPEQVFGLTRREREIKHILMIALDQLKSSGNLEELRYWLTEWDPKLYPTVKFLNADAAWEKLYSGIKEGFSKNHEEFCEKIVRGQPFLEKLWDLEKEYAQDTSKS